MVDLNQYPHGSLSDINKESDMNVPGIAKAKKSYHPVMTVKSYILAVR